MMFLKFFCCRESLLANISIGEIKNNPTTGNPVLEVMISLSLGSVRQSTDFLYLQPQSDYKGTFDKSLANTSTASSHYNRNIGGFDDKEPLPKRLRDVKKERVILIEKSSALCDNIGVGYIDLSIEKGKYKLYYMRIENEQRIISNSRLEVLGGSSSFSINKMTTEESQAKEENKNEDPLMYEEFYSYASQDSCCQQRNQKMRIGTPYQDDSSSLDSAVLMKQIQAQQFQNSQSQSVQSSDQTRMIIMSPGECDSSSYNNGSSSHHIENPHTSNSYSECGASQKSNSSSTYVVKKENDEAMIMTQQNSQQNNTSRHKRAMNIQNVLEDISNAQNARNNKNNGKQQKVKKVNKGKENKIECFKGKNEAWETKSHSFTNGQGNANQKINSKRKAALLELQQVQNNNEDDDELDVRYINDIDSLVPPRYNPDTRTYFKCSIYSPSNRLYTVNEEANSTQSDVCLTEQFSSSLMNSGYRKSGGKTGRSRIPAKLNSKSTANSTERQDFKDKNKIEEEDEDEDPGNISESLILPETPTNQIQKYLQLQNYEKNNEKQFSQSTTGAHTRSNSNKSQSKVQSLKSSIILQKPFSSHFSSILTSNQNINSKTQEVVDKKIMNKFLRETFTGILPQENGIQHLQRKNDEGVKNDELGSDINLYMQQIPGSFICTGGTEFQYETANFLGVKKSSNSSKSSEHSLSNASHSSKSKKGGLSIEKTKVKSNQSSNHSDKHFAQSVIKQVNSPVAYFDEDNRKVLIISNDPNDGDQVQHCIKWDDSTDPSVIGKAIEEVLLKVKTVETSSNKTACKVK